MEKYCRAGQATDDNVIWHMCIACWIPKATSTYSEYVIPVAFSLQQWLHESASLLRYTYFACLFDANVKYPLNYSMCTWPLFSKLYDSAFGSCTALTLGSRSKTILAFVLGTFGIHIFLINFSTLFLLTLILGRSWRQKVTFIHVFRFSCSWIE